MKLSVPENLLAMADEMTSGNSSGVDNRALVLCFVIMSAAGHFVRGLYDQQNEIMGPLQHYLRDTDPDVITAEAIIWIHFLMGKFWKADAEADPEMFERIGYVTTFRALRLALGVIEAQTGFDFEARGIESRKLYIEAMKDRSISYEPFATTVFRAVGCQSLAEPLKTILAPSLDPEWPRLAIQVGIFFSTMPSAFYETFKNFLRERPDRFPSDDDDDFDD